MHEMFRRFAGRAADMVGSTWAFVLALGALIVWAASGPAFHFSDTWQLIINTSTTIVTFLIVFLIQNTQNRDAKALHLKVDELLRATHGARNSMIDLGKLSDTQLRELEQHYLTVCASGDDDARSEVRP